ncbi:hypothetical protein RSAG8_11981, partial [Rhizoctonia solani AG-8 WAC10335]
MKFSTITFILFTTGVSFASPAPLEKRASITDKATIGFATLNGGTTGGGSAIPITVTALDALQKAVSGDSAKVVLISGTIQGATTVKVGSNTSYWRVLVLASVQSVKGHVFNNYFSNVNDGINARVGAELLVQNNVFENVAKPLYSTDNGYANASGNDFGGKSNAALSTSWSDVGYTYSLTATSSVTSTVNLNAGATLSF